MIFFWSGLPSLPSRHPSLQGWLPEGLPRIFLKHSLEICLVFCLIRQFIEREVGLVIEAVAKSCAEANEAAKRCWLNGRQESESHNVKIGASYDINWQKYRKRHNSLTGDYIFMLTSDFHYISFFLSLFFM